MTQVLVQPPSSNPFLNIDHTYIYLVYKFSCHIVKMGKKKYHLNFSGIYHGTIYHCSATGDWEKTNTCIGIGFRNRVSSFVGCNGSKLKDLYEKSFVSLPLIAIVSPFFFFLFLPVPALQPGVVLPRKKPKRKRCIQLKCISENNNQEIDVLKPLFIRRLHISE